MPRMVLCVMLILLLLSFSSVAGADDDELQGFGFAGPLIGLFSLDLEEVNDVLIDAGYAPISGQLFAFGGEGVGGVIGGFSLGGSGWGGSVTSLLGEKQVELSLGFGGMDLAYVVGGNERSFLTFGAVIGGGSVELILRDHFPESFEAAISNPTTTTLSQGFFALEPYVRFQVQPLSWLGFKLQLGYLFSFPGEWEEGERSIPGPSLNLSGPFVAITLTFGGIGRADMEEEVKGSVEEFLEEKGLDDGTACEAIREFYKEHCGDVLALTDAEESNATLVSQALVALSNGDLEILEPFLAQDVSWVSPDDFLAWSGTWVGKDAFISFLQTELTGEDLTTPSRPSLKIDRTFPSSDEVVVKWHLVPTEEGETVVYGVTICRVVDGLITSGRDYRN